MGLSRRDFCRMSPAEFWWASRAFSEEQERLSRERWEIMRMQTAILVQPHVKGRITPKKLLPFPWEKSNCADEAEDLTMEERRRRAEEALKKWG